MADRVPPMNTKFIGHHVSAGGFVFLKTDTFEQELLVLLTENKKGEFWVPKGHIEPGENSLSAARREIHEEVGIPEDALDHLGMCAVHRYSFVDIAGHTNTKEVHLHVFSTNTRNLSVETGDTEIVNAVWVPYEEALEKIIVYSQSHLERAHEVFLSAM